KLIWKLQLKHFSPATKLPKCLPPGAIAPKVSQSLDCGHGSRAISSGISMHSVRVKAIRANEARQQYATSSNSGRWKRREAAPAYRRSPESDDRSSGQPSPGVSSQMAEHARRQAHHYLLRLHARSDSQLLR